MNLSHLLSEFALSPLPEIEIAHLVSDSRLVQKNDLFFALTGSQWDGTQFIDEAISKGACAILMDGKQVEIRWQDNVPLIALPDLKNQTATLAQKFYDYPAKKMRMIGVTGTSGKTSCTQFIAAILHHLNIPCGVIGTLGNGLYGHIQPGNLTTPDAITLQKTLAALVEQGAVITAMEVSSHSLDQGRVNGIEFDIGIFTNLSHDHLDYHKTMEKYGAAKKRLFNQSHYAVINADDAFGFDLWESFKHKKRKNVLAYSVKNSHADLYADEVSLSHSGIKAHVMTPWSDSTLNSILVGEFNLQNLLAVVAALGLLDIHLSSVMEGIKNLHPVAGRMQSLGGGDRLPLVIVDYAHKPDALEKVLIALRQECHGKLYCIFGCGGDRDRGKRPMMAKLAEQYADQVIVTDDNPRHENPADIVKEIMQGFVNVSHVLVEHDRAKAIQKTIQSAQKGDCILIAGKGAETYQLINDQKHPFSDVDHVNAVFQTFPWEK